MHVEKAAVKGKEVLGNSNEEAKERCLEVYREEKREVKRCIYQSKKKVNEQLGPPDVEKIPGSRYRQRLGGQVGL